MKFTAAWNLKKKTKENPQCGCTRICKKPHVGKPDASFFQRLCVGSLWYFGNSDLCLTMWPCVNRSLNKESNQSVYKWLKFMASREQIATGKPPACPSTGTLPPAELLLFLLLSMVAFNSFANLSLPSQIYSPLMPFCGWLETSG